MKRRTGRHWQAAVLFLLAAGLLAGGRLHAEQGALADRVLRLHVLAASDAPEDQALKLAVRDRVLARAEELIDPADDLPAVLARLTGHLDDLARAGREAVLAAGRDDAVTAAVERAWFPTKRYEGFALPAGEYTALRVVVGPGEGKNWWCVIFPPLCLGAASGRAEETAAAAGLDRGQVALITGQSPAYQIKFRAMEMWERIIK